MRLCFFISKHASLIKGCVAEAYNRNRSPTMHDAEIMTHEIKKVSTICFLLYILGLFQYGVASF